MFFGIALFSMPVLSLAQSQQVSFSASPTSGTAPLSVAFSAMGLSPSGYYDIAYGDGANSGTLQAPPCAAAGGCTISANHTYTSASTYTATLKTDPCPGQACLMPVQFLGTVTITVSSSPTVSPTFTASPTTGTAPLSVSFTGTNLPAGSYTVTFGDGSTAPAVTPAGCTSTCSLTASHTYTTAGTYRPSITNGTQILATTVTVTGGTSTATFTASPSSGTAPLAVSFSYSDTMTNHSYAVDFGDGTSGPLFCSSAGSASCASGYTGSHTYTATGTYTAKLRNLAMACAPVDCNVIASATIMITSSGSQTTGCPPNADNCNFRNPSPSTTGPTPTCPAIYSSLSRGAHSQQVLALQLFFAQLFGIDQNTIATSYFGPITQSYVVRFQKEQGLPSTGLVGPMTRAKITGACSS